MTRISVGALVTCALLGQALTACSRRSNYASRKTLVKARFLEISRELEKEYGARGQFPETLASTGLPEDTLSDPFTGKRFLYVPAEDASGKRFACLIASTGGDGTFQISKAMYAGTNVGALPRNWTPPVAAFRADSVNHNVEAGDIAIQLVRDTHCTNEIGLNVGTRDAGEATGP